MTRSKPVSGTYSLQRLFLVRLLVILVPFAIAVLWGAYFVTLHFANAAFDRSLARRAYALADQVEVVRGKVVFDLPQEAHSVLEFDPTDIFYFRVIGPDGKDIAGTTSLRMPVSGRTPEEGQLKYFDAQVDEDRVRVVVYNLSLKGTRARGDVMILAGETIAKRIGLANDVLLTVFIPMIVVVLLLIYAISLGVKMSLKPVHAIKEAIASRSAHDLEPIEIQGLPTEIEPLLEEMNRLMTDLRTIHDSRQRFLADSAHQLRTPLASMRAQTELLLRSVQDAASREVLAGLLSSLDRQGRLVTQLLALSRVEDALTNVKPDDVRLDELARNIASEWVPRALERGIDLGFEAPGEPVHLTGHAHALSEALANLLDNALRYCRSGDQVTVRVYVEHGKACLAVSDTGAGVPEAALPKIFERFYRAPGVQAQGCGLGLAIVREVVEGLGGEVKAFNRAYNRAFNRDNAANGKPGGFEICLCIPQANYFG